MSTMTQLEVSIVHTLPGRIRLRLSRPPRDVTTFTGHVLGHAGLDTVEYNPVSRSVLLQFDPDDVHREEVVLRAAAAFALEYSLAAVRVVEPIKPPLTAPAAFYSALLLAGAGAARLLGSAAFVARMDRLAALGTAGAVIDHGWTELRERGYFDPEVLAVTYLGSTALYGHYLRASLMTWFITFGRHLFESPPLGVRVQLREQGRCEHGEMQYEIVIASDVQTPERVRLLGALQELVRETVIGADGQAANLFRGLHEVSRKHANVVDGLGAMQHGIPMRFE
ncbi:MAG: hypothetical protein ACLFTT_01610 [Candidatus Hydrogenedentota bacterium]